MPTLSRQMSSSSASVRPAVEKKIRPPWARPWSSLLWGELLDLEGRREEALQEYKKVLQEPYGREALRERAEEGMRRPFGPPGG